MCVPGRRLCLYDAFAFADRDELIGLYPGKGLDSAIGPANRQIDNGFGSESEVQAPVVGRIETGLCDYFLSLQPSTVSHGYSRADGASIAFGAHQLDLDPMVGPGHIVAKQGWRLVHVHDEDIDVAVIVEIAEGTAPAGVCRRNAGAAFVDQFLESPAAEIAENQARRLERISGDAALHFGVDASGDHEQVGKSIVVEIDDARSPPNVPGLDAEPRADSHVVEVTLPVVQIEHTRIVGEMRLEKVQAAVQVIVADADAHS